MKMQSINIIFKNELNINVLDKNIYSVIFEQMMNKQKESSQFNNYILHKKLKVKIKK